MRTKLVRMPEFNGDVFEVIGENDETGSRIIVNRSHALRSRIEVGERMAAEARTQLAQLEAACAAQQEQRA